MLRSRITTSRSNFVQRHRALVWGSVRMRDGSGESGGGLKSDWVGHTFLKVRLPHK